MELRHSTAQHGAALTGGVIDWRPLSVESVRFSWTHLRGASPSSKRNATSQATPFPFRNTCQDPRRAWGVGRLKCLFAHRPHRKPPAERAPAAARRSSRTCSSTVEAASVGARGGSAFTAAAAMSRSWSSGIDQEDAFGVFTKEPSCTPGSARCGLHGRPRGGARVGSPRWARIFCATASSSTTEISSIVLPHFAHRSASMPQLRRSSVAHSRRRSRPGSSGPRGSLPCGAGATGPSRRRFPRRRSPRDKVSRRLSSRAGASRACCRCHRT